MNPSEGELVFVEFRGVLPERGVEGSDEIFELAGEFPHSGHHWLECAEGFLRIIIVGVCAYGQACEGRYYLEDLSGTFEFVEQGFEFRC